MWSHSSDHSLDQWSKDKNTFPTYQAALLGFHCLSGRHTGENLTNIIMGILDQVKITLKVKYIYSGWFLLSLDHSVWSFHNGQHWKQHNDEKLWGTTTQFKSMLGLDIGCVCLFFSFTYEDVDYSCMGSCLACKKELIAHIFIFFSNCLESGQNFGVKKC